MRFGLSQIDITPPFYMPMGGYGDRQDNYDLVNDPLTFTALVLEDGGRRALIGAADLVRMPGDGTILGQLERLGGVVGCPRDSVLLNASHTHGGPLLPGPSVVYRSTHSSKRYAEFLYDQMAAAAREAVNNLSEGTLWFGEGKTDVPMNRRLERDGRVVNAPNPGGPFDDRLQVLAVRNAAGEMAGVGMRLSCHPVATAAQHRITADYPGAWRAEFARAFGPKVTPFFLQGAGADARPRHVADGDRWKGLKHPELETMGRDLMAQSLAVLTSGKLVEIRDLVLAGKIDPIQAPCEKLYSTREALEDLLKSSSGYKSYAEEGLRRLDAGDQLPDHAGFLVQTLWLNRELPLIGLDCEALIGLGRAVEAAVAPKKAMLLGYTNGCVAYVADTEELKRGGGTEGSTFFSALWSGPLLPGVENIMAAAVMKEPGL